MKPFNTIKNYKFALISLITILSVLSINYMSQAQKNNSNNKASIINKIKADILIKKAHFICQYAKTPNEYSKYFEEAIQLCPDNSEYYYDYAKNLYTQSLYKKAIPLLDKAINLNSKQNMYYYILALCYSRYDSPEYNFQKAVLNFKEALKLTNQPETKFEIYNKYNNLLTNISGIHNEEVTHNCQIMQNLNINLNKNQLWDLALNYRDNQDYNDAIKIIEKLLTSQNNKSNEKEDTENKEPLYYLNLGLCYDGLKNYNKAIECYNKSFSNIDNKLKIIADYLNLKDYKMALEEIKQANQPNFEPFQLYEYLIKIESKQINFNTTYTKTLKFDSYSINYIMPIVEQAIKIKKYDFAKEILNYCIKIAKYKIEPYIYLAELYNNQNNNEDYNNIINTIKKADYISIASKYKFVNSLNLCPNDFFN